MTGGHLMQNSKEPKNQLFQSIIITGSVRKNDVWTGMAKTKPLPPPPAPTTAGERLRAARAERGLTQGGLAARLGVSRSAIAQWETDRAGQIRGNLLRVADVLEVSLEYLLHGDDKRTPAQAATGGELALLRLYRDPPPEDNAAPNRAETGAGRMKFLAAGKN